LPPGTSIDYSISTDSCNVMQYWDGNQWTTGSGWSSAQTVNRYFSFLGAGTKNLCLKARLNTTDPNQTPSLDNIKINYNQTGGTDDIHTKKITSRVKWNNGLALQDISLSEYLTDWMYREFTTNTQSDFNTAGSTSAGLTVDANGTVYLAGPIISAQTYISAPIDIGQTSQIIKALWSVFELPIGTSLALQARTSNDGAAWGAWSTLVSLTLGNNESVLSGIANNQWVQYQIVFDPVSTGTTPVLDKITIQAKNLY